MKKTPALPNPFRTRAAGAAGPPAVSRPLLPALIAYCAGLIAGKYAAAPAWLALSCSGALLAALLWSAYTKRRFAATAAALAALCALGAAAITSALSPRHPPGHIARCAGGGKVNVEGIVTRSPRLTENRTYLVLRVTRLHTRARSRAACGLLRLSLGNAEKKYGYGDRLRFVCLVSRPRNFNNPGGFDYAGFLARRSVFATAFLPDDREIIRIGRGWGNPAVLRAERFRARISAAISSAVNPPARDILKALIIGKKGLIDERIREAFARLGVSHLLAISGLHAGIVLFVSYLLCSAALRCFPLLLLRTDAHRPAMALSAIPVGAYCFIAGFQLPTLRAFCMIGACLAALAINRKHDLLHALCLAAGIILVLDPAALFDLSFQLSFAAVLFMILLIPLGQPILDLPAKFSALLDPLQRTRLLNRIWTFGAGAGIASAAAVLATAPITAAAFHRVSLAGIFANIILVPLTGFFIVPAGLAASFFLPLFEPLALQLYKAAGVLIDEMLVLVTFWSRFEVADIFPVSPSPPEILFYYAALLLFIICCARKKYSLAAGVIIAFVTAELILASAPRADGRTMRVTFLDVGRGDAALVEFPRGRTMLIDGGGFWDNSFDIGKFVVAPCLYALDIKKVHYVVLSHPHQDHMGGLAHIVEQFSPDELWLNGDRVAHPSYTRLLHAAEKRGVRITCCSAGTQPHIIDGVTIHILSPDRGLHPDGAQRYEDINNNSLVMKLRYGNIQVLFTGDIHKDRETELVSHRVPLAATLLKVPHHGKRGSSCAAFIEAVNPEAALISCGSGRSASESSGRVLKRYAAAGARIYRTDTHGAVTFITDGSGYRIETFVTPPRMYHAGASREAHAYFNSAPMPPPQRLCFFGAFR